MKHLNLIDGSGYIYRAFYGLPPMKSPFGTPVNAAYGFVSMLTKLLIDSPADYFLILFDAKRQNWRNEIYPEYKANRIETPEDLKSQFPIIFEAAESFNIANVLEEGFEADDLIASYAKKAASEGFKVTIVSSDKDLMQLVGGNIYLYDPMKQKSIFEKEVFEKFGVYPDKVIDVQSLAGDSSDNIPGVPGIGIKTAAELINAYESLDNLLDNAFKIKQPKRKEALINYKEQALLSRELVTLKTNAPLRKDFDEMLFKCAPKEELFAFLDKYGFKSLYSKAEKLACKNGNGENFNVQNKEPSYELITDKQSLQKWIDKAYQQGVFAIDTETTGLNQLQDKLVGISLSVKEGEACYIPLRHTGKEGAQASLFGAEDVQKESLNQIDAAEALNMLTPLLKDKGVLKVGHNIKYDMHILTNEREDLEIFPLDDTMVLSYSLDGNLHSHAMDTLALDFLGHNTIKFEEVCGTGKNKLKFNEVEIEKAKDYAAEDADITLRLHKLFKNRMLSEKMSYVYEDLDRPLINILYKMERRGFCLDTKRLQKLSFEFGEQMQVLEAEIFQISGQSFNLSSPKQLGNILFEKMGLLGGKKTKTGDWQTGADVLEELSVDGNKFASLILEWRGLQKLKSTYTDALLTEINPKTGRVHTNFSQTITSTGRLSSSEPNLQNIPIKTDNGKKIRECFIAKNGYKLISADYSQIELRLIAQIAGVLELKEAFNKNIDIHAVTASKVFKVPLNEMTPDIRRKAKAVNFGIIYGISAFGLAAQLGCSRTEAKELIDDYFQEFPEIKDYMEKTVSLAESQGYVTTMFGRKCYLQGINDKNPSIRNFASRAAINAPIQGGAADIIKKAMILIDKEFEIYGKSAEMILQVHDELIFEVKEDLANEVALKIKSIMESVVDFGIPLTVEAGIGENWNDAH